MATLTDSYTNAAGLRTALRDAVGHPDQTVLLPDRSVDNACQRALDRLNADRPLIAVGTFTTVAGQQAYSPLAESAYGFRRVYWPRDACECYDEFVNAVQPALQFDPFAPIDEAGTLTPVEPNALYANIRQRAWVKKLSAVGASVIERTVYLDPIPGSAATVVFTYHAPRYTTFLSVRDGDRQRFLDLAEHFLHLRLSVGAGAVREVADGDDGTRITTDAAKHHAEAAKASMRAYLSARAPILPASAFP